jgi:hypothetical protein
MAITAASFPEYRTVTAAAILLFLLVNALVTAGYIQWLKRRDRAAETPAPPNDAVAGPGG